jgi:hypothetical protein
VNPPQLLLAFVLIALYAWWVYSGPRKDRKVRALLLGLGFCAASIFGFIWDVITGVAHLASSLLARL